MIILLEATCALKHIGIILETRYAPIKQPPSPIKESPSNQGPNPERNLVRTLTKATVSNIEPKETKENEPYSLPVHK